MSIGAKLGAEQLESSDDDTDLFGEDVEEDVEAYEEDDDASSGLVDEVRTQGADASCLTPVPCAEPPLGGSFVPPAFEDGVLPIVPLDGETEPRAEPPLGVRGCKRFAAWLRDMPPEELQICSATPAAWVAANRARELAQMPANKAARKELASQQERTYSRSSLELRHNIAERYEA